LGSFEGEAVVSDESLPEVGLANSNKTGKLQDGHVAASIPQNSR